MEIERKFLIDNLPDNLTLYENVDISQAYISADPVIRLRCENEHYALTVKGGGHVSREEFELELTKKQFDNLEKKLETRFIVKKRYFIPAQEYDLIYELDVYDGDLAGLVIVEVEFADIDACRLFNPPQWFGREVTYDPAYKNSNLAKLGKPWSAGV